MNPVRVSVLLPVRNAAATLSACLRSVAAQTESRHEVVVVDDGSTDATPDIVADAASRDSRLRLIRQSAEGIVAALNLGLAECRAPLVARMDADDRMRAPRLARQAAEFDLKPDLAVLGSRVELVASPVTGQGLHEYVRWQNALVDAAELANQRYVESPLTHPSVMYRRDLILAAGGYRAGLFAEDYDLWLRLFESGQRIEKHPAVLLDWVDVPTRLSRTDPRCSRAAFDSLRARFLARDPRVGGRKDGVVVWGAGRRTRQRVAHLQTCGVHVRAWVDIDPRKIGNVIQNAPVIEPAALANYGDAFVLSYVANHGAREDIARFLVQSGRKEGRDWLSVG